MFQQLILTNFSLFLFSICYFQHVFQISNQSKPITTIDAASSWSVNDISVWLTSINMKSYNSLFRRNQISGKSLQLLTESDLKNELQITSLGDRKALLFEIQRLNQWTGFLWRYDLAGQDNSVTLEITLSLSPDKMIALCSINSVDDAEIPAVKATWSFTSGGEKESDIVERFSTQASYDKQQTRSIIRLPCPVSECEVELEMI